MVNVGKYTSLMDPMGIFFKSFFLFTEAKLRGICMFITFTLLSSKQAREEELYTYIFFPHKRGDSRAQGPDESSLVPQMDMFH